MGRIATSTLVIAVLASGCGSQTGRSASNGKAPATLPVLAFDDTELTTTSIEVVKAPPGKGIADAVVIVTEPTGPSPTHAPPPGKGL